MAMAKKKSETKIEETNNELEAVSGESMAGYGVARATNREVKTIKTTDCFLTQTPSLRAMSGNTAVKIIFFQFNASKTAHRLPADTIKNKSSFVTDKTSPNR